MTLRAPMTFRLFVTATLAMTGVCIVKLSTSVHTSDADHANESTGLASTIQAMSFSISAHDNIVGDGRPVSGRRACLILPSFLRPDNTDSRLKNQAVSHKMIGISSVGQNRQCDIRTTPSLISSNLARRVTLVGAKPSGTG